ncbi:hypothetical protein [Corynebacterium diphtheriae]|uniref:hypothetical protein n=1 Tax=Corynebacterium diphtheriae TaxID=1717 RepID=UPI0031406953
MIGKKRFAKNNEKVILLDTQDFQQLLADRFAGICRDNFRRPDAFMSVVDGEALISVPNKHVATPANLRKIAAYLLDKADEGEEKND